MAPESDNQPVDEKLQSDVLKPQTANRDITIDGLAVYLQRAGGRWYDPDADMASSDHCHVHLATNTPPDQ